MTVYQVMPGVMICFSDMHMEKCVSEFELRNDKKVFCMDHCREGRDLQSVRRSWVERDFSYSMSPPVDLTTAICAR